MGAPAGSKNPFRVKGLKKHPRRKKRDRQSIPRPTVASSALRDLGKKLLTNEFTEHQEREMNRNASDDDEGGREKRRAVATKYD